MEVKTYRARSMQEALVEVRRELGPQASVLHTREVRGGWLRWISGARLIEVSASADVSVPRRPPASNHRMAEITASASRLPIAGIDLETAPPIRVRDESPDEATDARSAISLRRPPRLDERELPASLFRLFTDLIDADLGEELARELVEGMRNEAAGEELADPLLAKARVARLIEAQIPTSGPIQAAAGHRRLVALVGPTGVGKTTTIAKLAANFRLKEKRRVGLITVDTYRIAAVEQLRTYADIIDLPMEVVSTPREMRQAAARLSDMDLVLMDTAGRSPRDEVKIQELKSLLAEAAPDEVHLVLSSVASAASLSRTAEQFAPVGTTALVLTKLDEAAGLGNLLPLVRSSKLPLSYLTHGQNVPDDIEAAESWRLARLVLGMEVPTR